jgi:hypothetical protein
MRKFARVFQGSGVFQGSDIGFSYGSGLVFLSDLDLCWFFFGIWILVFLLDVGFGFGFSYGIWILNFQRIMVFSFFKARKREVD